MWWDLLRLLIAARTQGRNDCNPLHAKRGVLQTGGDEATAKHTMPCSRGGQRGFPREKNVADAL